LESAAALMKVNGVGSLVVVNNQGELAGFLHSGKIIKRSKTNLSSTAGRS